MKLKTSEMKICSLPIGLAKKTLIFLLKDPVVYSSMPLRYVDLSTILDGSR